MLNAEGRVLKLKCKGGWGLEMTRAVEMNNRRLARIYMYERA